MKFHMLAIALVLFSVTGLRAQDQGMRTFTARVIDRTDNDAVAFATVHLEGSTLSTLTDLNGLFSLDIPSGQSSRKSYLTITHFGYRTMRFRVRGSHQGRQGTVKLKRIKFDLRRIEQTGDGTVGPPPLIEK
jgi:hypothetical protein